MQWHHAALLGSERRGRGARRPRRDRRRRRADVVPARRQRRVDRRCDRGRPSGRAPWTIHVEEGGYTALGDSYSSGEGAGDYDEDSNTGKDRCHRSALAWPELVAQKLRLAQGLSFWACSGARIDNIVRTIGHPEEGASFKTEPPQIGHVAGLRRSHHPQHRRQRPRVRIRRPVLPDAPPVLGARVGPVGAPGSQDRQHTAAPRARTPPRGGAERADRPRRVPELPHRTRVARASRASSRSPRPTGCGCTARSRR